MKNPIHLFSRNDIPGNDNEKLMKSTEQNLAVDRIETANIERIDDSMI